MKLIDKEKYEAKVVALMKRHPQSTDNLNIGYRNALTDALNILDTLEVKEMDLDSNTLEDNVVIKTDWEGDWVLKKAQKGE